MNRKGLRGSAAAWARVSGNIKVNGVTLTGAEELRRTLSNLEICAEYFLDRFTAVELLQLGRMLLASKWDIYPDRWSDRQIKEALLGTPPDFNDDETPKHGEATS